MFDSRSSDAEEVTTKHRKSRASKMDGKGKSTNKIPNPYAASSSENDEEEAEEADLDDVQNIRRSILQQQRRQPVKVVSERSQGSRVVSERAKKGWLAHQSIFPASSSESDSESEVDKITEDESEAEEEERKGRSVMMGRSRVARKGSQHGKGKTSRQEDDDLEDRGEEDDPDGYLLSPSELYHASSVPPAYACGNDLNEPLLGPDDLEPAGSRAQIPVRLQVYHGRFGHWEREGLRKYRGAS